ncbi:hypothetical protein [Halorientalis sp.]|jgi:hypothetical protein|uniref:hypothetical protein n=1 Tax=Halorientalis sp. TaxID=1931229 RepID=UPI00261BBC0F|nr:hypothetical protein [Halorientalis sp.]
MTEDWLSGEETKRLDTQVAVDGERNGLWFQRTQPNPGGWIHDMPVYHDGEW